MQSVYGWIIRQSFVQQSSSLLKSTLPKICSLKSVPRRKRYSKSNPQHYNITSSTNVSHQTMSQLLTHKRNKQSVVELLMGPSRDHLSRTGLQFVLVGHSIMYHSTYDETTNNQEEADTLTHFIMWKCLLWSQC